MQLGFRGIWMVLSLFALVLASPAAGEEFRVLVFSKTAGFRHASIPEGIALVQSLGLAHDFAVDASEDATDFEALNLAQYAAVIWLSTSGNVLDAAQEAAFENYIQAGGGFVGVHGASTTEPDWAWYGGLLGNDARFAQHPAQQTGTLAVVATHVSTQGLPASFTLFDEWYDFINDPTPVVNVLLTVDEASYAGAQMGLGAAHPISWNHFYDGGRAWYTAVGHGTSTLSDANFSAHLLGGIEWAAEQPVAPVPAVSALGIAALVCLLAALAGARLISLTPPRDSRRLASAGP